MNVILSVEVHLMKKLFAGVMCLFLCRNTDVDFGSPVSFYTVLYIMFFPFCSSMFTHFAGSDRFYLYRACTLLYVVEIIHLSMLSVFFHVQLIHPSFCFGCCFTVQRVRLPRIISFHLRVFTTSFLHSTRFSAFCISIFHSRPVHSLMLSSHRLSAFSSPPPFSPPPPPPPIPWTVPCRIVLASPDDRVTCPYHFSLRLFTEVKRSSYDPMAFPILAEAKTPDTSPAEEATCKSSLVIHILG